MSQQKEKRDPGKSASVQSAKAPKELPCGRTSWRFCLLSLLVFLLFAGTAVAIFYLWNQQRSRFLYLETQSLRIENEMAKMQQGLSQQQQALAKNHLQLAAFIKSPSRKDNTVLDQVATLVRWASVQLFVERNPSDALLLLQEAQKMVARTQDTALSSVQLALQRDISELQTAAVVDKPLLLAQLDSLRTHIVHLPFVSPSERATKTQPNEALLKKAHDASINSDKWRAKIKAFFYALGDVLSHMVVISKNPQVDAYFLTQGQRLSLVQNMQAQITLAQWAVLHHQETVYSQSLSRITLWLRTYCVVDDVVVQKLLMTLSKMQAIAIDPKLPDTLHSLSALQQIDTQ